MKKVIIRKDMVKKAILAAVPNAVFGEDFDVGKKVVYEVKQDAPLSDAIVEACKKIAEEKGVGYDIKYWGDGYLEFRFDESPIDMGDWNDPSSRHHY